MSGCVSRCLGSKASATRTSNSSDTSTRPLSVKTPGESSDRGVTAKARCGIVPASSPAHASASAPGPSCRGSLLPRLTHRVPSPSPPCSADAFNEEGKPMPGMLSVIHFLIKLRKARCNRPFPRPRRCTSRACSRLSHSCPHPIAGSVRYRPTVPPCVSQAPSCVSVLSYLPS